MSDATLVGLTQGTPVYWRNADGAEFRPIPGTENATWASFSPDGESLVFGTAGAGLLQRVALSGGAPQLVATLPFGTTGGVHWGDDGNVVFSQAGGRGLYRVPASGGEPEALLDPATPVRNARLLPGGRAVIFTEPLVLSTYLLDLEADSVRELQTGAIDAVYVETGHLIYADVSGTLWAVAFDPRAGEVVGEPATLFGGLTKTAAAYARFSVSKTGTLVYGAGLGGGPGEGRRFLVVDLEGNEEPVTLTPRDIRSVRWSPDRQSVVYASAAEGNQNPDIYTYNMELGTTPRQLTFDGSNLFPVFSPDGTRVVFMSLRGGTDAYDLFVKTLDDDEPARSIITLPISQVPVQWPSDRLILFVDGASATAPADLWMLDLSNPDSAVAVEYLSSEADLRDIEVSPDGTLAAYTSNESGRTEVYIRSFPEAGGQTRVSQDGGQIPFWSPDGNTIYYWTVGVAGLEDDFMAAHIQREPTPVVLSREALFSGDYFRPASDLHPDGDRVIVAQNATISANLDAAAAEAQRFIVVTNWFEELRERMGN